MGIHTYNEIIRALKFISPDIIILYELNSIVVEERIRAYCEKHNIRLIIEVTEWMEVENRKEIATRGIVWQKDIQKRYIDKRCGNIIAISEFLYEHYRNQGCNVIRLPPLVYDFADKDQVFRDRDAVKLRQVKLVFAGTTDFKDYLEPMLKAIRKINNNEIKIIFDVVGPSPDAIESMLECSSPTQYGINCYGHLSHENTLSIVREADFSVLMRENKRYAKAGVSTKFVEAMSLAVPSICTAVGGTDAFVTDGVDGVLIKDNSVHEVLDKLVQITNMDSSKILQMKLNALNTAKQVFSEGQYYNVAKCFLEGEGFDSQNKEEAKL